MLNKVRVVGLCAILLSGCSFIPTLPGAEKVVLFQPEQVTRCNYLGSVKVNVVQEFGLFKRSPTKVARDLRELAQNSAVDMGGDTLTAVSAVEQGAQVFNVYRCMK